MQHDPRCGAILCAAEEELAPFLPHLAEEQRLSRAMLTLHIGRIGSLQMVLAATGMCKVNAALAVQTVLDTVSPDFVLNAGTAGGMSPALGLFDTAVTTECAYHDVGEDILTNYHLIIPGCPPCGLPPIPTCSQPAGVPRKGPPAASTSAGR